MTKNYAKSLKFVRQLGASSNYYNRDDILWYDKDPLVLFIIRPDGEIMLRHAFTDQQLSIYDLWNDFSKDQKKLIIYNLDRFK